jgi:ApeA-like protein/HEPN superfamily Apea-like protein
MTIYLSEPAEWKGYFWPAEDQAQARPGVLSYAPDTGLLLDLIGGFNDAKWVPARGGVGQVLTTPTREWSVVHGVAARMPITLLDCAFLGSSGSAVGDEPDEQKIHVMQALVGVHLPDESSASFNGIEIWVENLSLWAAESDIRRTMWVGESNRRWEINVEQTESRFAHLDGMTAELGRGHVLIDSDMRRSHLNVATHEISSISFRSKQPRPLKDWFEMVGVTQDLISLAMDKPCAVLGQTLSPTEEAKDNPASPARSEVPLYTKGLVAAQPDEHAERLHEVLFTLNDTRFDLVLTRWIYMQKRFITACNMLLGLRYISRSFIENQLTTAVGAAEVFHRTLEKKPPVPAEEFAAMKKQIRDCVPAGRRQWVDSRLWNEPSLKERLIDLATTPDSEIMNRLVPNPKAWAKATAQARNGIAHRGKADLDEMYAFVTVTTAVVLMNLLLQLEIPKERLVWALIDNDTLSGAARLSAKYWPAS